ncbi:hypothetical protein QQ045_025235 [Rhodiola kirilowii]
MAVDANFAALFRELKPDDPWLPPRPWESIPSESGLAGAPAATSSTSFKRLYDTRAVSEASIVRLALNALQGSESAILCIEKLSAAFCSDPADRSFHQIPSLWTRITSTHALGKILQAIGCAGSSVFHLYKFVDYFTDLKSNLELGSIEKAKPQSSGGQDGLHNEVEDQPRYSLVNQAFAVAIRKVLGGYIGALETVCASAALRRSGKVVSSKTELPSGAGCLKSIVHGELTLLEVYIHTAELRNQIQSLANICKIQEGVDFSILSLSNTLKRVSLGFSHFPRGASLLSYLYSQLEVAEQAHTALLKFLFQKSCEPYFRFIRQWIFEAKISDPYNEFIIECVEDTAPPSPGRVGIFSEVPLAIVREREEVDVPCFLSTISTPLFRAGQQLQVVKKVLELCSFSASGLHYEEIVPCFTSDLPSSASLLSLKKNDLEAMVNERNNFYELLQSKLEKFSMKLDIRYHQVAHGAMSVSSGFQIIQTSAAVGDDLCSFEYKKDVNMVIGKQDAGSCSLSDEFSYLSDQMNASDWSSSSCYDDDSEPEQVIETPISSSDNKPTYLSSLRFSSIIPSECSYGMSSLNEKSCVAEAIQKPEHCRTEDCDSTHLHLDKLTQTNLCSSTDSFGVPTFSWMPINREASKHSDVCESCVEIAKTSSLLKGKEDNTSTPEKTLSRMVLSESYLTEGTEDDTTTSKSWKLKKPRNFLCRNPILRKIDNFRTLCNDKEDAVMDNMGILSSFDFSNVEYPFMGVGDTSGSQLSYRNRSAMGHFMDSYAVATGVAASSSHSDDIFGKPIINGSHSNMPPIKPTDEGLSHRLVGVSGGSDWEKQLFNYGTSINVDAKNRKQTVQDVFEIPIDFIIDKCLLQEIKLQYSYISKLTIKLLKEGFSLQEHLKALRRYHLMEVADWADLFIMSLWHHKWCRDEGEKRIPQIQGLLESSIQRSSCDRDPLKDRLFVFTNQQSTSSLNVDAVGVSTFKFLGLGYRVDWPASIVLTSGALRIYSQIFNFLMQVKLANFALTNMWCSMKGLKHVQSNSGSHTRKTCDFIMLVNLRHQVNHFVTSLQQYLLSQLSHVSWSRFLKSLDYKVKDMMDLEAVHMEYLTDSLQICFLSDETKMASSIITKILQCALDFRSCMMRGTCRVANDSSCCINLSQIISIKNSFDKYLKELYLCHLKSHQHAEFGLSHFWRVLNYNDFYSSSI